MNRYQLLALKATCDFFGLRPAQLLASGGKHPHLSRPRHIAMWLLHREGLSYPQAARALGLTNHTTVLHGVRHVEEDIALWLMAYAIACWMETV